MDALMLIWLILPILLIHSLWSARKAIQRHKSDLAATFGLPPQKGEQEDFQSISAYWRQLKEHKPSPRSVDDITWNDLDMDQVFRRINICQTSPGEEVLYARLRALADLEAGWEEGLAALEADPDMRLAIQVLLYQMGKSDDNGIPELATSAADESLPHPLLIRICSYLPFAAILLSIFYLPIGIILLIASLAINGGLSYWGKKKLRGRLHTAAYASSLLWCAKKLARLSMPGLESFKNRLMQYIKPFAHLGGALSGVVRQTVSIGDMSGIITMFQIFLLLDLKGYNRAMSAFTRHREALEGLYNTIGDLDVLIAVLSFRKSLPFYCQPQFGKALTLDFQAMTHPLLDGGIANSLTLHRGALITGSNASGKSTFIKAVAVNCILAQAIHTCCAKVFVLPQARVLSSMALRDSLTGGDSYFVAEIKSFRRILDAARQTTCLCFVDEILRGTNTIERIAASAAVLSALQKENSLCLVATHDIELTQILQSQYDNYHFREHLENGAVRFDFILHPGPSRTRNAILLLDVMGFPPKVIERAQTMVSAFEADHSWPPFEMENAIRQERGNAS